jgi:hypothetical protein
LLCRPFGRRYYSNTALEKKGADLIDDARALANEPTHSVRCLQVELIGGSLRRHKFHRWSLHRLSDCLRVAEVVLLSLRVGGTYFASVSRTS